MELEVRDLRKSFGEREILHGISFTTHSGQAFGLLGRNGAGKTTTLRLLINIFKANSGEILLNKKPFKPEPYQIGYLPEERGLYPKKPVNEQLIYFARLRGLSYIEAEKNMKQWLHKFDITKYEKTRVEKLSKGTQQKVQLAQALICNPEIIILDEPFTGLDPVNSKLLQDLIREMVHANKLVIFSSHQMNYVEQICEEIAIMKEGHIVLNGKVDTIKNKFGAHRLLVKSSNIENQTLERICFEKFNHIVNVYDTKKEGLILELLQGKSQNELLESMMVNGIEIEQFGFYKPSLADIFVLKAGNER